MNISKDKKKIEALNRMRRLGISKDIITAFAANDIVTVSDTYATTPVYPADKAQLEVIEQLEKEYNILIYHIIHSVSNIGVLDNYLFVSNYPEDWEIDNSNISSNQQYVYVHNLTYADCSEFGEIGVDFVLGELTRTW